jgi:glycosyltransferase involved in cell wall biosynthesis
MTSPAKPLRILHAVRAPVGGIIRHILDLANGQAERGHEVGIVADSLTGGPRADAALSEIAPRLSLGVHRIAIHREPHPLDVVSYAKLSRLIRKLNPVVLHGHGAKAGVFMRAQHRRAGMIRVYTPHGGSLHYPLSTKKGQFYSRLERAMMNRTELFLFESAFARNTFQRTIGIPKGVVRCVFNGVTAREFEPLAIAADATDVAYVGEFRHIKGADIVIDATARLGLASAVRFLGHVPARTGFSKGRLLVVPSRGDSMPYVVIEAAAAGIPILAAKVGGIPEILGPDHPNLVPSDNVPALADAIAAAIDNPLGMQDRAKALRERVQAHFSQTAMVEGILTAYADAFAEQ